MMLGFNAELEKMAGIGSAAKGALRGMVIPAARAVGNAATSGARDVGGLVSRFGKRQVHGLTGWTPKGGIQSIRGGAYEAGQRLRNAEQAINAPTKQRFLDKAMLRTPEQAHVKQVMGRSKELKDARKAHAAAQKAEDMGLTSLPGYAKSMVKHGPGKTISTGVKEQWHSMGPTGKGLMVGLPALSVGSELAREGKPGEGGRLERAGERLGDVAYMMGPVPIAGQTAAQIALSGVGKRVGKLLGGKKTKPQPQAKSTPAPPSLEPAGGEVEPAEHIVSDRAMGLAGGA